MKPAGGQSGPWSRGQPGHAQDRPACPRALEEARQRALAQSCEVLRGRLARRDPLSVASLAAMAVSSAGLALTGHLWGEAFMITWPELDVRRLSGDRATLREGLLWLHYLDRADGRPLSGQAVTLRELGGGGLFYQQAFQGYAGDELVRAWGQDVDGLARRCRETGGWPFPGPADLSFEWLALPRVPVYVHYRLADLAEAPRAAVLFDAATCHYVAVDVAAVLGKGLVDRLIRSSVV